MSVYRRCVFGRVLCETRRQCGESAAKKFAGDAIRRIYAACWNYAICGINPCRTFGVDRPTTTV